MTKLYAQEKRVFDINKVTVVGSPTITSDGVASGFSVNDYLTLNTTGFFNNNYNFEIDSKVKYTSDTTTEQEIWDFSWIFRCRIWYTNNKHRLDFYMPYGSNYTNTSAYLEDYGFVEGDDLYIRCISENASSRKLMFSKDGQKWNTIKNTNTTDKDLTANNLLKIGQYNNTVWWLTSIDLTSFKIYVDNELVYSPTKPAYLLERRKEGFDRSKFTVVGSPSITEDGIFEKITTSTANLSDYVTMPFDNTSSYFRLEFNFYFGSGAARLIGDSLISCFQIYVSNWGMNGTIYNSTDGNVIIPAPVNSSTAIQIGNYNAFIEYKDNVYTIGYKREEETSFKTSSTTSATKGSKNLLSVLKQTDANTNLKVDLKSITIFSNGKEVFTGAKEKFYAMRGGK